MIVNTWRWPDIEDKNRNTSKKRNKLIEVDDETYMYFLPSTISPCLPLPNFMRNIIMPNFLREKKYFSCHTAHILPFGICPTLRDLHMPNFTNTKLYKSCHMPDFAFPAICQKLYKCQNYCLLPCTQLYKFQKYGLPLGTCPTLQLLLHAASVPLSVLRLTWWVVIEVLVLKCFLQCNTYRYLWCALRTIFS